MQTEKELNEVLGKIPININIKNRMKDELSGLWQVSYEEGQEYFVLQFDDGYEYIEAYVHFNEHFNIYEMDVSYFDYDNEIIAPESCHDCSTDCQFYKKGDCTTKPEKEMAEHMRKKTLKGNKVSISPDIIGRKCFVNISHNHYYKGYLLEFCVDNVNFIEILLNINYFIDIYESFIAKQKNI